MENASKALIMAATVLLGVMIISIGVALFNTFVEFSKDTIEKMDEKKLAEWNNNYFKYYGTVITEKENKTTINPIQVTAHDIISVVNLAKQNNEKYELTESSRGDANTYYVQVILEGKPIETWTEEEKNDFLKDNSIVIKTDSETGKVITTETKYYKCSKEPVVSSITKRVMTIEFVEY